MEINTQQKQEFESKHFDSLRRLVTKHTGIKLADSKVEMVYRRFAPRIKKLGLDDFGEYCKILKSDDYEEITRFSNIITTNHTSFFRENHHFEYLSNTRLPELKKKKSKSRRIRIWSAGCSSGEEAYSIAMVLLESIPDIDCWDVKILATDINTDCLKKCEQAIYSGKSLENISRLRLKRWFQCEEKNGRIRAQVRPELQSLITFKALNLMEEWPFSGQFDVILCRNVMIYFDKTTQKKLIDKFSRHQKTGDTLIIGHSENISMISDDYSICGQTTYCRN
ncbi:MAG: chemotaxis protein CheR [Pseudomonadales bacterium]|nr:chemotaxis protein CheR [Pseudomonadales bacterium]